MVKKDQLWAIAFTKRRYDKLFRFYLKWLLWQPATALEILFDSSDAKSIIINNNNFISVSSVFSTVVLIGDAVNK